MLQLKFLLLAVHTTLLFYDISKKKHLVKLKGNALISTTNATISYCVVSLIRIDTNKSAGYTTRISATKKKEKTRYNTMKILVVSQKPKN